MLYAVSARLAFAWTTRTTTVSAWSAQGRDKTFSVRPITSDWVNFFKTLVRGSVFAEPGQGVVARNPVEPGTEGAGIDQARHSSDNIEPHVLESIFGILQVGEHPPKGSPHIAC